MLGSLADWTTAGIALLAFIVAAVAARYTAQTNRAQQQTLELQRKQYEDARQQLRRAQAELISYWTEDDLVHVVNASSSPIYHVRLLSPHRRAFWARTLVVRPTGTANHSMELPSGLGSAVKASAMLLFNDAAGRRWARNQGGVLSPMTEALVKVESDAMETADPPLTSAESLSFGVSMFSRLDPAYMVRPDES
jgi:hypothetical protein